MPHRVLIQRYRDSLLQIATPYSTGTGLYLRHLDLIVTNEQVVRDNREVVVISQLTGRQLARVCYMDSYYDLAFLQTTAPLETPVVSLEASTQAQVGDKVIALGLASGAHYPAHAWGRLEALDQEDNGIHYLRHSAVLEPGNSGGPLLHANGDLLGINVFDGSQIALALPTAQLRTVLNEYLDAGAAPAARCYACHRLVLQKQRSGRGCPYCGHYLSFPDDAPEYEPAGVQYTVEQIIEATGQPIKLSRRGPNAWEIHEGSARIHISYHEESGLITGDAYLCKLPERGRTALYRYLLQQNYAIEGLTFSTKGGEIILSLLIYDRYLNVDTGLAHFRRLFEQADYYDNVLVEQYGAVWKDAQTEEE